MLGDLLEAAGLLTIAAAAFTWLGAPLALLALGVALVYLGNCHAGRRIWRRKS